MQHLTGLRGIAILMVVLFHLCPILFPNGFYGVDIFFVITGYLLFFGWKKEPLFILGNFLKKKVIRIYPCLSVLVLLAGLCIAPFLYETSDAQQFGKNCLYSLIGVSNIYYTQVYSDYFATESNINPLLHTWYLSATIQIYLMWAIGAALLRPFSSRIKLSCVCIVALISLLYYFSYSLQQIVVECGLSGWEQHAAISYYNSLGRVWQVLAGGLIFIIPLANSRWKNVSLFIFGLAALIYSSFYNHESSEWMPLLVVAGTVLVLRYAESAKLPVFLENKMLLFFGKISFSLYLVHFPIFVFYRRWERTEPCMVWCVILLLVALGAAWLLWRYIETYRFTRLQGFLLFGVALALALLCRGIYKLGLKWDMRSIAYPVYHLSDEHINYPATVHSGYNEQLLKPDSGTSDLLRSDCGNRSMLSLSGKNKNPEFVLIGNSVAQQLYAGFHEICKEKNISGVHLTTVIYPIWDYHVWLSDSYCWTEKKAEAFMDWLRHQPDLHTVVVSFLWKADENTKKNIHYKTWNGLSAIKTLKSTMPNVQQFCKQVKRTGKQVVFLTPTPVFMDFADKSQLGKGEDYVQWRKQRGKKIDMTAAEDPFVISESEYLKFNEDVFKMLYQLEREGYCKLLHIEEGIFQEGNFAGLHNGILFCRDRTHVTPPASIYIMRGVANQFAEIINQNRCQSMKTQGASL